MPFPLDRDKAIAVTLCRRPTEARNLLSSLLDCYGITDYRVYIGVDVDERYEQLSEECVAVALDFAKHAPVHVEVYVNRPRLGIDEIKLDLMPRVFGHHDYAIFLEDDTPIARDGLRFFEAMNHQFAGEPRIWAVTGYNRYCEQETHERVLREEPYAVDRGRGFSPWGWAMWAVTWEQYVGEDAQHYREWCADKSGPTNGLFDHYFTEMFKRDGCYTVYPVMPRTNHTGAELAEHTPSREYLESNEMAPFGAWSQEMPDVPESFVWQRKW